MSFNVIMALVFAIGLAVFAFQNTVGVQVTFLYWISPMVPISIVVLAAAATGVFVMYLIDTVRVFQAGRRIRQETKNNRKYRREIKELKAEIARLKGKKSAASPEKAEIESPGDTLPVDE